MLLCFSVLNFVSELILLSWLQFIIIIIIIIIVMSQGGSYSC
jgi:hypothetical protein